MFQRILIANRGEIACRVIDTCRTLGVETVAVYSDADATARHVQMADRAIHIGGSAPADSYLKGDVIIQAALDTGAQAIHPGYGFLSENPDFVDAVEAAGLIFIGPSSGAMRKMGLKDAAKAEMQDAGVPIVPGYHGADQADVRLAQEAAQIGWPVMIKAVAGGGGKGMRLVDAEADFQDALNSARAEAKAAFGNDSVLIEKAVTRPRHIEVQVFGDGKRAVHLFERDCSLQRRHQKVIEEAPAPDLSAKMRAEIGQAAVCAAEAIGHAGAGTIEFIAEGDLSAFYFMEMNTRLQVEHPVTEAVTGVDLVEWQLRVASGEALPMTQDALTLTGHAVEARLYAEDPSNGFLPMTGRLAALEFPKGLRIETGVREGDEITPFYDPMIAKLIAHGPTRDIAFQRLSSGLSRLRIAGTITNAGFLKALIDHPRVRAGDVETGLIGTEIGALTTVAQIDSAELAVAAIAAMGLGAKGDVLKGFALWQSQPQTVTLMDGEKAYTVSVACDGPDARVVTVDHTTLHALRTSGGWEIEGMAYPNAICHGAQITNGSHTLTIHDPMVAASAELDTGDTVLAPMPGRVVRVATSAGETVQAGQVLAVLEAMKMEHALKAPKDGTVAEILVVEGNQVSQGDALVRLEGD